MFYEVFLQGPEVYIPVLIASCIATLVGYGTFPLTFAIVRKKPITKKKYRRLCYGINIVVMFLFVFINGEASSGGPYLLWSWIFSSWGVRILEGKDLLVDGSDIPNAPTRSQERSAPASNAKQIRFCRRCGAKLLDESRFCNQCGTQIIKE